MSLYTYGVDIGTTAISIAALGEKKNRVWTIHFGKLPRQDSHGEKESASSSRAKRFASIRRELAGHGDDPGFIRLLARDYPPYVVWIEQPSGRWRNLPLTYMAGVIQEAFYAALNEHRTYPVSVFTLTPAEAKKAAVGTGNATKAQVLSWAKALDPKVLTDHEADAYAVAHAGAVMTAVREVV